MVKKRKNTKGTKQNVDNKAKEQTHKPRSSKRKSARRTNRINNRGHGEVDDYHLRNQVEAGEFYVGNVDSNFAT